MGESSPSYDIARIPIPPLGGHPASLGGWFFSLAACTYGIVAHSWIPFFLHQSSISASSSNDQHDLLYPLPWQASRVMLMNPAEVIVHEMQGHGMSLIFNLLAEPIGQPGHPSHTHPHGEILPFYKAR